MGVEKKKKKDKKAEAAGAAEPEPSSKKDKKGKKDDGSGRLTEIAEQINIAEDQISALQQGGSDKAVQSALAAQLKALDAVDAPSGSPARNEKRALIKRVERLQNRAEHAIKVVVEE